jgi:hypothetical protein
MVDIYAHVLPEMQQEAVKRMDDLYGGFVELRGLRPLGGRIAL